MREYRIAAIPETHWRRVIAAGIIMPCVCGRAPIRLIEPTEGASAHAMQHA